MFRVRKLDGELSNRGMLRGCGQSFESVSKSFFGEAQFFRVEYREKLFFCLTPLRFSDNHHGLSRRVRTGTSETDL